MKNDVIETYEHYREEERLTTNPARRLEYLTTVRILDRLIPKGTRVLDCAAGTGLYAFHLAERECQVTATDLTPRHVALMRKQLEGKSYTMETAVMDATDLSAFGDDSFDAVLNMGPLYHLTEEEQRDRCLSECCRVLKPGGLLFTAYIPRFFILQYTALRSENGLSRELMEQLRETGELRHQDEGCFWTDTYYATEEEMTRRYQEKGLEVVDHFAQDGLAPLFAEEVDSWSEERLQRWQEHHFAVCREPSTLGMSNHVMIVGRR